MKKKKDRIFTGVFIAMMLSSALISLCNYLFYSTMPLYAAQIGASPALVGFVTGVYTLACFVTRTFAGSLCDRYGRFMMMILGAALCIIGCTGYLFSWNILLLLLMRAVHGVGFGSHTTAGGTVAVDVLPPSRRMEGLGYFSLYSTISSAVGPGLALAIVENERLGFQALFLLSALIMAVILLLDLSVKKAVVSESDAVVRKNRSGEHPRTFLGFEARAIAPCAIMAVLCFAQSSVISFLAVYALQNNLGNIGMFFTIASIAIFVSRFCVGKLGDRWGMQYVLVPCIFLSGTSLVLIALFPVKWVILCCALPYGLGFGAAGPIINTMVVTLCDDSHRSSATSMYYASLDIGLGLGSILLGALASAISYKWMILASGLIAASSMWIYLLFIARSHHLHPFKNRRFT